MTFSTQRVITEVTEGEDNHEGESARATQNRDELGTIDMAKARARISKETKEQEGGKGRHCNGSNVSWSLLG